MAQHQVRLQVAIEIALHEAAMSAVAETAAAAGQYIVRNLLGIS